MEADSLPLPTAPLSFMPLVLLLPRVNLNHIIPETRLVGGGLSEGAEAAQRRQGGARVGLKGRAASKDSKDKAFCNTQLLGVPALALCNVAQYTPKPIQHVSRGTTDTASLWETQADLGVKTFWFSGAVQKGASTPRSSEKPSEGPQSSGLLVGVQVSLAPPRPSHPPLPWPERSESWGPCEFSL